MATSQPPRHEEAKQARSYVSFITDEKDLEKKKHAWNSWNKVVIIFIIL